MKYGIIQTILYLDQLFSEVRKKKYWVAMHTNLQTLDIDYKTFQKQIEKV